jgi:type II secretory pathway predicted ATPase ExeA
LQPNASGHPKDLLLIVDEAHLLPLRLLEEVRLITDFMRRRQTARTVWLLAGSRRRWKSVSPRPRLNSLQQRITARCYLEPLDS